MALILSNRYPGQADPPSPEYPQGAFKNKSAPGALDGTPFEKDVFNDIIGLLQSLISAASFTPNDQVDRVGASQYFDALLKLISDRAGRPGEVCFYLKNSPPQGYLVANGAAISRSTYADLFAVTGTVFGPGNGSTTFNLPDLRGEFIRGWDGGRGVDAGRAFGSRQSDLFKSHRHNLTSTITKGIGGISGSGERVAFISNSYEPGTVTEGGVETRPRNVALLPCVRY